MTNRAEELLSHCVAQGISIAVAESLTGGLLAAELVQVPGASAVFRGAVVSYATELKASVLGVDADLLDREGPVHADVARQMAQGVQRWASIEDSPARLGIATTGVAGPGAQDGVPAGTVFVAAALDAEVRVCGLMLSGEREAVRRASVGAALRLALELLGVEPGSESAGGTPPLWPRRVGE